MRSIFSQPKEDVVAGVVVFLVALPLCLGLAIACGVSPVSGLVAGIVGGLVVPLVSKAPLSVTGPAAGLTSIVLLEVERLGSVDKFLGAVVAAGVLQLLLGLVRAGRFATLVPSAVIQGMLAAIGITIVLKQLPVAAGVKGSMMDIPANLHVGATVLTGVSLVILYGWKHTPLARLKLVPPALVAVGVATGLALVFQNISVLALTDAHYVRVPLGGASGLVAALPRPDFSVLTTSLGWVAALTIALVASIETLLSLQAVDRLDPLKRQSPPDRELVAQGLGNLVSGLGGGLPITSVIVRSGANVAAGGRDRLATMVHGLLLLLAVLLGAALLNKIPLACLAAVLLQVGLNLAKPSSFASQKRLGASQFVPFLVTIGLVLALDLLKGVVLGVVVGVGFALRQVADGAVSRTTEDDGTNRVTFHRDGTFLVKPALVSELAAIPDGSRVVLDGTGEHLDHDVKETLATFLADAPARQLVVELVGIDLKGATVAAH